MKILVLFANFSKNNLLERLKNLDIEISLYFYKDEMSDRHTHKPVNKQSSDFTHEMNRRFLSSNLLIINLWNTHPFLSVFNRHTAKLTILI